MKHLVCALFALLALSCGKAENGKDGDTVVGPVGPSGPEGTPGEPGKPAEPTTPGSVKLVVSHVHCDLSTQVESTASGYPKFELSYQKTVLNDESALVVLGVKKFFSEAASPNIESVASFFVKGEAAYNLASAETTLWKAELSSQNQVKFSYKPSALAKTASCK